MQIEVQCIKNYFNIFLTQEVGAFGKDKEKEPQKARPKFKKICIIYICSACNPMQVIVFSKHV